MRKSLEEHQLVKTIWLLVSRETKEHWCRTEDVRTINEGDMNTDRWKIDTPPGIGNGKQECNEDKLETRVMRLEDQTKWMYDRMTAAAEPSTWNRFGSIKMIWTLVKGERYQGVWRRSLTVKRMGWPDCFRNWRRVSGLRLMNQDGVLTRTMKQWEI